MVSNYGNNKNWKRINLQLVSLACGLALATVVVVGGSEVLRDRGDNGTISPIRVAQPAGPVMDPTDFGSLGVESMLAQQEAIVSSAAALENARGIGQLGEGASSGPATFVDPTDFGSLGIESVLQSQYSTAADAVYDAMDLGGSQSVPSASIVALQDARGIGQPGEGSQSVSATFADETDFGSLGIESILNLASGATTDEDFGGNYLPYAQAGVVPSDAPLFGTMVDAVYVMEVDIQLP